MITHGLFFIIMVYFWIWEFGSRIVLYPYSGKNGIVSVSLEKGIETLDSTMFSKSVQARVKEYCGKIPRVYLQKSGASNLGEICLLKVKQMNQNNAR